MKHNRISSMILCVALAASAAVSVSCQKEEKEDKFGILTMSLAMPNGQAIECVVNGDALTIDNSADPIEPGLPASMLDMTVTFTATIGTEVSCNGTSLVSGESVIDVSEPVTLVATKNGKSVNYTLTIVSDPNDKTETEGKKVTADMRQAGFPDAAWYDIVMFKGAFWALTSSYPDGTAETNTAYYQVYKSLDGISWSKVNTNIKAVGAYGARLVVFGDKLFALGGGKYYGTDEDGVAPDLMYGMANISGMFAYSSEDGENWTAITPVITPTPLMSGYVDTKYFVSGDKLVYIGGLGVMFSQMQYAGMIVTSADGTNWTVEMEASSAAEYVEGIKNRNGSATYTFKGKHYVAAGFKNYLGEPNPDWYFNSVYSSADGLAWAIESDNCGISGLWNARVAGTDEVLYMVGGETQDSEGKRSVSNKVYRSTDGVNWAELSGDIAMSANFAGRQRPCLVVDGDILWIFGGRGITSDYYGGLDAADEVLFDVWKKRIK